MKTADDTADHHTAEPLLAQPQRMNGKPVFIVPAKRVLNMESGFVHKLLCDGPTFSTGDACAYSCAFCYVPDMFRKLARVDGLKRAHGLEHADMVVRRGDALEILRTELVTATGRPRFPDPTDHRVIYASPAVDVAANPDLCEETARACELILTHTAWQIRLLSKSNLLPKIAQRLEQICPGLNPRGRIIYGVSTGTLIDGLAQSFESNTPLVRRRIQSLHWLQDEGFRTFGMICPSLPLPVGTYATFANEMAQAIRAERCEHVWAEVINVRGDSMTRTVQALRDGGWKFHARALEQVGTDPVAWEEYARATFEAHATIYAGQTGPALVTAAQPASMSPGPKLRFLQYVTKHSKAWWEAQRDRGAILL